MAESQTTAHTATSHHVDPLMGIILPYVNFAVFVALLIYFARKPAVAAARKRRDDFESLMAEATKAREAAETRLQALTEKQAQLDSEIQEILLSTKAAAENEAAKIVADAERLAEHLKTEARRIAEAEVLRASNELRHEIVAAVKESVGKKITTELTQDAQIALARRRIAELRTMITES